MNRPYAPEPRTHYDGADGHGYAMNDVLDPPELNDLVDELERQNVVYVRGTRYIIDQLAMGPTSDGTYFARLRPEDIPF